MSALLFHIMLAFFLTHEMDAVKRHEWRVLPLFSLMPERLGALLFIWLHVPLIIIILWYGAGNPESFFAQGLSSFAVAHAGIHVMYRKHPAYEFNNAGSWILIALTAAFGTAHLFAVHI